MQYVQISTRESAIKPKDFTVNKRSDRSYRVRFHKSASLNEMASSFGFAPGFIVDANGNALTTTSQSTYVETVTTVDS